jgi:hypothetical protein
MYIAVHAKNPFLSGLNETLLFWRDPPPPAPEKYLISNFMKIRVVGAEFIHVDGQTERRADR